MDGLSRIDDLQEKFNENPRRYFAPLANEYRKAGNAKRAIEICRAHLAQLPGHMSGQIVYGQSLFEGGEYEEARKVFEGALVLDPENRIALRSLGDLSLQAGDTAEARGWYTQVLDADPKDAAVIALVSEIDALLDSSPPPDGLVLHYPTEPPVEDDDEMLIDPIITDDRYTTAELEEPIEEEPKHDEPVLDEPVEDGSVLGEPVEDGPVLDEPVEDGPVLDEPVEDEPVLDEPVEDGHEGEEHDEHTVANAAPFVNETMAQLYLQQGYRQLALKVYRQLLESRPADQSLKDRISEIESAEPSETRSPHSAPVIARVAVNSDFPMSSYPTPRAVPVFRKEEPPSVESPLAPSTESPREPSTESPSGEPIDSPPSTAPGSEPDSIESPVREEPRVEPELIAARQPSIREFFATLGRRRPPRRTPVAMDRAPSVEHPESAPLAAAPPSVALDAVFAGASVSAADSRAASALAGAFSGSARGSNPPPPSSTPTPRMNQRVAHSPESEEDVARFRAWLDGLTGE